MTELNPTRVLVWDENPGHAPKEVYPEGIRGAIAEGLRLLGGETLEVKTAHLDDPNQGCSQEALNNVDVLLWWAHARHGLVDDDVARRIKEQVHERGMGFIALHSAHYSKPLQWTLACPGHLKGGWREQTPSDTEEIRVCAPKHPIAKGVNDFVLPEEEMYGAPFDTPPSSCVVFQSYFPAGGEYFPSSVWTVGKGKDPYFTSGPGNGVGEGEGAGRVFYFRPGHEAYPTYFDGNVRKILFNAVMWAARRGA